MTGGPGSHAVSDFAMRRHAHISLGNVRCEVHTIASKPMQECHVMQSGSSSQSGGRSLLAKDGIEGAQEQAAEGVSAPAPGSPEGFVCDKKCRTQVCSPTWILCITRLYEKSRFPSNSSLWSDVRISSEFGGKQYHSR